MKTIASALFLALAVFATGCSWYKNFTYSSPEGRTCLTKCENARWECRNRCGAKADAVCLKDCDTAAEACRKTCPEISTGEPDSTY